QALAARWASQWDGAVRGVEEEAPDGVVPAAEVLSGSSATVRLELTERQLHQCRERPAFLLELLRSAVKDNVALARLGAFLKGRALSAHRRCLTPGRWRGNRVPVEVDLAVLVESLGEVLLRPASEVWLELAVPRGLPAPLRQEVEGALGRHPDQAAEGGGL